MEETPEGGERGHCQREGSTSGMASGGVTEDGGFSGPWGDEQREGSPLWGWTGDEETLPLLSPEDPEVETLDPEMVIAGPWDLKSVNPFETNLWSTLPEVLLEQEVFPRKHVVKETFG